MKVLIGKRRATLDDADLLGVGGEARVFRFQDLAVKIFHTTDTTSKLEKIAAFPKGLPKEVVAPIDLVHDLKKHPIGYTMPAIKGAQDIARLGNRRFREGVVSNQQVTDLFTSIHRVLSEIHEKSVVVGDFNDGNILFESARPWFIDADSMQFGSFPCVVGHERFLDPRLYGLNLQVPGGLFTKTSDWYAFAVLLFSCLLYVHPYGGVHRKLPTLLRRAEAGHSVLRDDVCYPKAAQHYRILPASLLEHFESVFDKRWRGEFPLDLLTIPWMRCKCGLEHALARCPDCASFGAVARREAIRYSGGCQAIQIFRTNGRVIGAVMQGGLKYLYEEDGIVRREDGTRVMEGEPQPAMRFAISGRATWIGLGDRLVCVENEKRSEQSSTGTYRGRSSFDANRESCYRLANEWLTDGASGLRVGKILEGQTWLRVGEKLGFGFYRPGLKTFFFLFKQGRAGLIDVPLPPIDGRIVEANVVFDDRHALFFLCTEKQGQRTARLLLIRQDGRVIGQMEGAPDDRRVLQPTLGRCMVDGRILTATEQGLMSLNVDGQTGVIFEGTLFEDTEPFVAAGAEILPGPAGSVYVVTTKEITQLVLV